jgi:hypothetical protein
MSAEDELEEEEGMDCFTGEEDDNNITFDTDVASGAPAVSSAPGRFLTALTCAPPPGKTKRTKKAKALLAASRMEAASRKKGLPPPPASQVSVAAELAKSVIKTKAEIAKLAGSTQDQLKLLDENKLKLEEVKLKLEELTHVSGLE